MATYVLFDSSYNGNFWSQSVENWRVVKAKGGLYLKMLFHLLIYFEYQFETPTPKSPLPGPHCQAHTSTHVAGSHPRSPTPGTPPPTPLGGKCLESWILRITWDPTTRKTKKRNNNEANNKQQQQQHKTGQQQQPREQKQSNKNMKHINRTRTRTERTRTNQKPNTKDKNKTQTTHIHITHTTQNIKHQRRE